MNPLDLSPAEFQDFLTEERQYRSPEQIDDLIRRYNAANSLSGRLAGLLEPQEGRRRTSIFPASVPVGMSLMEALQSGEAEFAIPQGIVDMVTGTVRGVENPTLAAQGRIPASDMNATGFETAAAAMGLGGLLATKPAGSLGMSVLRDAPDEGFEGYLSRVNPSGTRIAAEDRPNLMMGDMYGMLPRGSDIIGEKGDITFYRSPDGNYYATAYNPDVGEQDVVGYIMGRGDSTELQVVSEMQGQGIGGELQYLFRSENPDAPTGGLTEAGERSLERTYDRLFDEGLVSANASKSAGLLSVASDVSARGDQILNMLKSGRGSEVTDAMLDMGDGVKNTQLNQYLAANYDLPMDEASRLARAREMGLLDAAYHSTGRDFQNFVPSEFRGASFFAATPEGASKGASASANEGVGSGSKITMPVRVDTSGVEGIGAYARKDMNEFRASLPDRIYTEAEVDALMASDAAPLRGNWSDFFDDLTDYDALRKFRDENPTKEIPDGIVKFRPKRPKSYNKDLKTDLSGRQFAHYSEGMSERPTSEYVKSQGNTGFTMMDESGLALAMVDPTKVRSQFARFDPRLSHLSNVTAANASPISGLLAQSGVSSEQAQMIEDYLNKTGLLQ